MHKLLQRQLRRYLGESQTLDPQWQALLEAIDQTYQQMDQDRALMERSLELTSQELRSRYQALEQQLASQSEQQRRLQQTLAVMRATLESSADAIIAISSYGRVQHFNQEFIALWNLQEVNLERAHISQFFDRIMEQVEQPEGFMEAIRALHRNSQAEGRDLVMMKDGRLLERISWPQRQGEAYIGRVWSFRDITERHQSKQRLRLSTKVFDSTSQGIVVLDRFGCIQEVNQAFCQLFMAEEAQLRGQPLAEKLASSRHDKYFYQDLLDDVREQQSWSGEIWELNPHTKQLLVLWVSISLVRDNQDQVEHMICMFSDITAMKQAEEKLQQLAYEDQLTGLANRTRLQENLHSAMQEPGMQGKRVAIFYMDLDRFKHVNDVFGHAAGDWLLGEVAKRLQKAIRASDLVARQGGDEFIIALLDVTSTTEVEEVAKRILRLMSDPFVLGQQELFVGATIGIDTGTVGQDNWQVLMRHADMALNHAKRSGKNTYLFFEAHWHDHAKQRLQLETELRYAIEHSELELHLQPQITMDSKRLVGFEGLVRWQHPRRGMVMPGHFISIAEETGLIVPLGEWVLQEACRLQAQWQQQGLPLVSMAVNLSPLQLQDKGLPERLADYLRRHQLDPHWLELEITESLAMQHQDVSYQILQVLQEMGVGLALDDFGTGYSSLSQLKRFPFTKLKIDRSFVLDLLDDENDRDITRSIIQLGKTLGLHVLAEGVEEEAQRQLLAKLGCHYFQGYLYSRPLPPTQAELFLRQRHRSRLKRPG
ncbi:putative bifunctional diguanylate cyclase/phosphodiesterase [Balneatrix alpica]|uniref:EAL domain-containing protein n=1 Tax=Balneatrix alpica TaxID=75684 RepID=A0ABV5ZER4_9GAMM|nr:bifunctional diguanylate cyclase/phosphodiesterase [Balneatrix alpica]